MTQDPYEGHEVLTRLAKLRDVILQMAVHQAEAERERDKLVRDAATEGVYVERAVAEAAGISIRRYHAVVNAIVNEERGEAVAPESASD